MLLRVYRGGRYVIQESLTECTCKKNYKNIMSVTLILKVYVCAIN